MSAAAHTINCASDAHLNHSALDARGRGLPAPETPGGIFEEKKDRLWMRI